MGTDLESQIDVMLGGSEPLNGLIGIVNDLKKQGLGQREVYLLFENCMFRMRGAGREDDEAYIMEVMDLISGFCSPSARLFPESPYDPDLGKKTG